MAAFGTMLAILSAFCIGVPNGGEFCNTKQFPHTAYKYCEYGCCNDTCCASFSPWIITLIIFSIIIGVSVTLTIIRCCIIHHGYSGRVIRPAPAFQASSVAMVQSGQSAQTMMAWQAGGQTGAYYGPAYGIQPPAYQPPPGVAGPFTQGSPPL